MTRWNGTTRQETMQAHGAFVSRWQRRQHGEFVAASRHLVNKLRETLGREAGEDLMTWLEEERAERKSVRLDFATLRSDFGRIEARLDTVIEKQNTSIEKQNVRLEQALKEQTRFFFLAWAVQVAAIVGLYAR